MNRQDKLVEETIKMLIESTDTNTNYKSFSKKVADIAGQLTKSPNYGVFRSKNIITFEIEQYDLIDAEDCFNSVLKQAKIPFKTPVDYDIIENEKTGTTKPIPNEKFDKAIDYVENEYMPAIENYMNLHNKKCENLIWKTFKDNGINIKSIETRVNNPIHKYANDNEYKYSRIEGLIEAILKEFKDSYALYIYYYTYIITIDINDNLNIN